MITTVDRLCQNCGCQFSTPAWKIKQGRGKFCSVECFNQFQLGKAWCRPEIQSEAQKDSYERNPERSINNSKVMKQLWQTPEFRKRVLEARDTSEARRKQSEGNSIASKELWQNPQIRVHIINSRKRVCQSLEYRSKRSELTRRMWGRPEFREKILKARQGISKRMWQDPEFVAKTLKGLNKKPTKPEQKMIDIFNKYLPQFKYNGDLSLGIVLGGLIPDFVNINGKKEIVEVFGDYFHSPRLLGDRWQGSELGKVMIYNSVGWKCLVIWEHELNELSESEIVAKINRFAK